MQECSSRLLSEAVSTQNLQNRTQHSSSGAASVPANERLLCCLLSAVRTSLVPVEAMGRWPQNSGAPRCLQAWHQHIAHPLPMHVHCCIELSGRVSPASLCESCTETKGRQGVGWIRWPAGPEPENSLRSRDNVSPHDNNSYLEPARRPLFSCRLWPQ